MASGGFSPGTSGGINFAYIAQKMGPVLGNTETALRTRLDNLGDNPTQTDLLDMQVGLQKWTMLIQLQSTINKELGDALKGIIQKAA
ncbi:MAG: EscF/YscF/HrpA family type III secretion system needle major subunit [Ottowia sp.]|uniref:EscF/YscF/HrpA family type III secretion system needle major subunit n=1 Tax=unclassified Ottowia TaxID=2645081 RepID=UPI003C2CF4E2